MIRLHGLMSVVLVSLASPPAWAQYTWVGGDHNWNNAGNWLPAAVPNAAGATVTFSNQAAGTINIASSVQANQINFTNVGFGNFTLTSNPGQTLSGLTAINYIGVLNQGVQTVNFAYQASGNLFIGYPAPLTITNNSSGALVIGQNTVIGDGTASGAGVVFAGSGYTVMGGSFASGFSAVTGGVTKTGPGYLDFAGDGTQLRGGLTLNGGTVALDYNDIEGSDAPKFPVNSLSLAPFTSSGGVLAVIGGTAAPTEGFGPATFAANHTEISTSSNVANGGLFLGSLTRSPGATVDLSSAGAPVDFTTNSSNVRGLLGDGHAYITVSGSTWATLSGGATGQDISGLPDASYGADTYSAGTNTDFISPSQSIVATATTNSIRFNNNPGATNYLYLVGSNLTLQSGGILMTSKSGPVVIQGFAGTESLIAGGTGELLVHQYNTLYSMEIDARIGATGGLTKAGPGLLILGGNNTGLTGPINLNQGNLTVKTPAAINSASTINLNDNGGTFPQYLAFDVGDSVNGTINTNIRLGNLVGSSISTGSSTNSTVTLSGVISSIPGQATPLTFGAGIARPQDVTSTVNLTNSNTFLGDVHLVAGGLGINSNASLGNPANTLYLQAGNSTGVGLVFLLNGIDLARSVSLAGGYPTRIVINGTNVSYVSGFIGDSSGHGRVYKAGLGTLVLTGSNGYSGGTEIDAGTLSIGADANLGAAAASVAINAGATLGVSTTFSTARPLVLGPTSNTAVNGPANVNVTLGQTLTLTGAVNDNFGPGTLTLTGPGTVVLGNNFFSTYSGGTVVQNGTLQVATDSALGSPVGPVTVNALGTLTFNGSDTTARAFNLNFGTLGVAAGQTLTLSGASVGGGFLAGPGAFAVTGGTLLAGVTTYASTPISVTGAASFTNFTNGGPLTVAAGTATPTTFTRFTNQGSAAITIAANSQVNVSDFETYGLLTVANGTGATKTLLTNIGSTPLYFNGGSRTFVGAVGGNAATAGIELNGQNAIVAGGLFVNNGQVTDNSALGISTIIADYGALVKGSGQYDNSPVTQNGGKFQSGNSPGVATMGRFVFGPGGVSNYVFAIDDATGQAGPTPDALGHVSGWGMVKTAVWQRPAGLTSGDFVWTADPADKLTVALDTLVNPTTAGTDVPGLMADFDPAKSYSWPAVQWTGTYSGPTDVAALDAATNFDTSGFANPIAGSFGWQLDPGGQTLSLNYTPSAVPEPGTLTLVGLAAVGWLTRWRRRLQPNCRQLGAVA